LLPVSDVNPAYAHLPAPNNTGVARQSAFALVPVFYFDRWGVQSALEKPARPNFNAHAKDIVEAALLEGGERVSADHAPVRYHAHPADAVNHGAICTRSFNDSHSLAAGVNITRVTVRGRSAVDPAGGREETKL
jgi:Flp pilus assembly protein CpaB